MTGSSTPRRLTCDEVREMAGSFVLGALTPAEQDEVRAHLATCHDAHPEIAELGGVLPALGASVPIVEPPDGLKARILAAAAADLATRDGRVAAAPTGPVAVPTPTGRAARRSGTSTGGWILRIAAVLAIVALGGWNLFLRNELSAAQDYQQRVAQVLEVASQPGSLTAILTADGGTGNGIAAVSATGDIALAMQDLAPTSGDAVYEAWAIGPDGVPVPIGSFTVGRDGTASLDTDGVPVADEMILAVTLEPGPGATTPTLPIISKGVASQAG